MAATTDSPFLGRVTQSCDLNRCGVNGHLGVNDIWFKFLKKGSLYLHTFDVFSWDLDTMIFG